MRGERETVNLLFISNTIVHNNTSATKAPSSLTVSHLPAKLLEHVQMQQGPAKKFCGGKKAFFF